MRKKQTSRPSWLWYFILSHRLIYAVTEGRKKHRQVSHQSHKHIHTLTHKHTLTNTLLLKFPGLLNYLLHVAAVSRTSPTPSRPLSLSCTSWQRTASSWSSTEPSPTPSAAPANLRSRLVNEVETWLTSRSRTCRLRGESSLGRDWR